MSAVVLHFLIRRDLRGAEGGTSLGGAGGSGSVCIIAVGVLFDFVYCVYADVQVLTELLLP